jgi:hypothetical protein
LRTGGRADPFGCGDHVAVAQHQFDPVPQQPVV